jgi:hypothetical protein
MNTTDLHPFKEALEPGSSKASQDMKDLYSLHTWPAPPTPTRSHLGISIADTQIPKTPTSAKSLQSDFTSYFSSNGGTTSNFSSDEYLCSASSSSAPTTPIRKTYFTRPQSDGFGDFNVLDTLYEKSPLDYFQCAVFGSKSRNVQEEEDTSQWSVDSDEPQFVQSTSLQVREVPRGLRKKKFALDLRLDQTKFALAVPLAIVVTPPPSPHKSSGSSTHKIKIRNSTTNFSLPSSQILRSSAPLALRSV